MSEHYNFHKRNQLVKRFPRLDEKRLRKQEKLAALDAEAFICIERGREANIAIGRVFRKIKHLLHHGEWEAHFDKFFKPLGIRSRTARSWMRMAREEHEHSKPVAAKTANSADLDTRTQAEKAQALEAAAAKGLEEKERPHKYNVSVFVTAKEQELIRKLVKSPSWEKSVQRETIELWRKRYEEGSK
jgi:hypothetical protein